LLIINLFDNQFHQIIGTFDGSTMKLFIDGKFNASISCNGLQTGTTKFRIGAHSSVGTYQANGLIDEVRIYNRALSDEEIKQLYEQSRIKFQNDFIQIKATKTFLNITNSTNTLYSLFIPSIRLDGNPIYYYFSTNETKIYFFDWYSNSWKIWMQGVNNATHGSPDFSLPKFKQEFKLLYSFDSSKTDAKINLTFILTNHDPFLRTIIDVNSVKYHRLEIPVETQNQQKACLIADYQNGKLASWNQRNCAERGNSYSSYSPVWNLKFPFNDTGLVGYWKFDEGSGTIAKDSSGYNNDGTLVNGPTWVDGKFGKALKFDGVDDYVNVGHSESVNIVNAITIAAWVMFLRDPALDRYSGILGKTYTDYKGYNLQTGPYTGKLLFTFGTGSAWINVQSNTVFTTGRFYHVVGTFDGTVAKFYTNGVLDCSPVAYSGTIAEDPTKDLLIGQVPDGTTKYVNAIIDEVRIYNRALSEEEIKQHYEQQVIFYSENYENKGNEWNLSSQVNKTDLLNTTFYLDNDLYKTNTQQIELPIPDSSSAKVYYQAQDGSYRDVKELEDIGQGLWSYEVTRDDSLVLWQSFDEGSGLIAHDFSDYGNDGIIYGANWTDGKFGKALSFDGVDDYVEIPNSASLNPTKITIEYWIYLRDNRYARDIISKRTADNVGGFVFETGGGSPNLVRHSLYIAGGWQIVQFNYELNQWLHIAITFDGSKIVGYKNGVYQTETPISGNLNAVPAVLRIGKDSERTNDREVNAIIDEVRIYNRALSEEEIKAHYLYGLPKHGIKNKLLLTSTLAGSDGFDYGIRDSYPGGSYWLDEKGNSLDSGLVGYWKFSEGSGTTTADSSGYGNTGTLKNITGSCGGTACPSWTTGKYGNALYFDAVGDYVEINSANLRFTGPHTLTSWIKTSIGWSWRPLTAIQQYRYGLWYYYWANSTHEQCLLRASRNPGSTLYELDYGFFNVPVGTCANNNMKLHDNNWHFVVQVFDGTNLYIYLDGKLLAKGVGNTRSYTNTDNPTYLAYHDWPALCCANDHFGGIMDEVRIYNRALSDDEIKALYQAGRIRLSNDFLTVQSHPSIQTNLTNSTNSNLFNLIAEEIKVDNRPLTNIYPANPINNSINVYFFDWKDNTWKIWMKGANNLTHGVPDWLDPRFKQEFKWRYEFKRDLYPSINLTFLMTSHDPFVRVFVDAVNSSASNNITLPFVPTQSEKRLGMKADYASEKLPGWNQRPLKWGSIQNLGNPWGYHRDINYPEGKIAQTIINSGANSYLHDSNYVFTTTSLSGLESSWTLDKTNNKYSFEFYLDNDLQKVSPTTIWDTVVTSDWSITAGTGTLYNDTSDYISGTESLNASVTSDADGFIALTYNPAGTWDFSTKEFLALWLKLNSTSEYFTINVTDSLGNWTLWNRSTPANTLQDLNNTWRRWVIPLRKYELNGSGGPADLTSIDKIEIKVKVNPSTDYWIKVDDIVIDVGQWVKVETFIPDKLTSTSRTIYFYFWNRTTNTYDYAFSYDPYDSYIADAEGSGGFKFWLTDGTQLADIYGSGSEVYNKAWAVYPIGTRKETKTRSYGSTYAGDITYSSYYGVKNRIGFAIKMPPDDGQDNSTYGISQVKLKLEVYYDDEGKATYEFSNDNNQYYGLQNQLAPYYFLYNYQTNDLPLFITTNKRGAYSSYGSFLQVRADENEVYDKIQFSYDFNSTINQNLMFTLGYLGLTDTYISSSGDTNVPDIFEGYKTWQFGNESFESVANSTLTYYDLKDDSLVGYWDFDEGSGTIAGDRSGNGNTGTIYGATWVDGKFGKALSFDGVDDYVQVSHNPSLSITDAITIEAWIKPSSLTPVYQEILSKGGDYNSNNDNYDIYLHYTRVAIHWKNDVYESLTGILINTWTHIAITIDVPNLISKMYINGNLDKTFTITTVPEANTNPLVIGKYIIGSPYPFNGLIDEVRIYNRALSEEEIKAHYYSGLESHQYGKFENSDKNVTHTFSYSFKYNSTYIDDFNVGIKRYVGVEDSSTNLQPITPKDTVLHLRFNEGSGNKVKDISGFGNDGTIYGQTNSNTTVLQLTGSSPISLDHYIPGYKPEKPATLVVYYINNTADLSYNTVNVYVNGNLVGSFNDAGETSVQTVSFSINPAYLLDGNKITYSGNVTNITQSDLILDPWVSRSNFGKALKFDGFNDYIDIGTPNSLNITEGITLSAWVYPNPGGGQIVTKWNSYDLRVRGAGDGRAQGGVWLGGIYYGITGGPNLEGKIAHIG